MGETEATVVEFIIRATVTTSSAARTDTKRGPRAATQSKAF